MCSGRSRSFRRCSPRSRTRDSRQLVVLEHGAGRLREQHLPAVACSHDAGGAMDAEAVVALVAEVRLARVQPHADTALGALGPGVLGERALRRDRGQGGVRRLAKGDEERVALRVDLLSLVLCEGGAQDPAVIGEHLAVPVSQLLQQPGRALDVREEERDGPAREVGHPLRVYDPADRPTRRRRPAPSRCRIRAAIRAAASSRSAAAGRSGGRPRTAGSRRTGSIRRRPRRTASRAPG